LKSATLPSDFIIVKRDSFILFLYIDVSCETPSVLSSVKVKNDMTFEVTLRNAPISPRKFRHLLLDPNRVATISEVLNLLADVKSLASDECPSPDLLIEVVIDIISRLLLLPDIEHRELLDFIKEQLQLTLVHKQAKRYSSNMIILAFLWHLTSANLYRKLSDFFILPTTRRLQQLYKPLAVRQGHIDMDYLTLRTAAQPKGISQNFIMLVDEIYTAERIDYVDGEFLGLTSEGETAKTLLVFMIKSLASKQKDVVCIIPKKTLTASELESDFLSVLTSISTICDVKAVSVDNNAVNRSFR